MKYHETDTRYYFHPIVDGEIWPEARFGGFDSVGEATAWMQRAQLSNAIVDRFALVRVDRTPVAGPFLPQLTPLAGERSEPDVGD